MNQQTNDQQAKIESLLRQNRRLKLVLYSTLTALFLCIATASAVLVVGAVAARNQQLRAIEMERRARKQLQAALTSQTIDQVAPAKELSTGEAP